MNYFELIQELCYSTGVGEDPPVSFNDTDEETTKYKKYINQALAEIFSEKWNFRRDIQTFSTVIGQSSYDMPAGIIEKIKIETPLEHEIDPYKLTEQSGTPNKYYVLGNKLYLYPTPNKVETITIYFLNLYSGISASGTKKIGLSLETDSPNIPEVFHDLVVKKAELIYMRDKPNKNNSQARINIKKRIDQLIDLDRGTFEASPIIVI